MPSTSATEAAADSPTVESADPISCPQSLHHAVYARRSEYVRPHRIRIKIGTWNVAASRGTDKDLASWFVSGRGVDGRLAHRALNNHDAAIERQEAGHHGDSDGDGDSEAIRLVGGNKVGIYALGLQEVVDLNVANQYINRVYDTSGPGVMAKWKMALETALPPGYECVVAEQMSGLLLLVYASPEVTATVSSVSTSAVGTGILGYLGNKGSVAARLVLGETTRIVFANCHLSSGAGNNPSHLERRCWDYGQITKTTRFEPVQLPGLDGGEAEKWGDEDFAFVFGDLNFRLEDLPGDDIRRLLMLHTRGEYGARQGGGQDQGQDQDQPIDGEDAIVLRSPESSDDRASDDSTTQSQDANPDDSSTSLPDPDEFLPDPSDDPASIQATLDSLLPHDQLRKVMKQRKAFHDGWREGPITFLPSYKYDVGTVSLFDSSEKRRAPSWCDRILYRSRKDRENYETKVREEDEARKKDEEMKARGMEHAGDDDDVLFDYDPDNDGDDPSSGDANIDYDEYDDDGSPEEQEVTTKEGFVDRIQQDIYTSHQRIQSSDHKPVVSVFTLEYDAVVPELKARIHAEVAKELDRAENEGRPGVTIVTDGQLSAAEAHDESVDFGHVHFMQRKSCSLTIANTGRVPATFSFIENPRAEGSDGTDEAAMATWLRTSFSREDGNADGEKAVEGAGDVTLEPGETTHAVLDVFVGDIGQVRQLNAGQRHLEEVLVLRVKEGRDHFIPVRGSWVPTSIGRSIDELIRVPDGGIRAFIEAQPADKPLLESIPYEFDVHCGAPKELIKLTEATLSWTERVLADEQMLEERKIPKDRAGWPFEDRTRESDTMDITKVIEALDNDKPIAEAFSPETSSLVRLETVCQVLLLFLEGLVDGIVTVPLWLRIEQAGLSSLTPSSSTPKDATSKDEENDKEAIRDILSSAPHHSISFVFLMTTLSKMISELAPLSKADLDALQANSGGIGGVIGSLGRRSLSLRRGGPDRNSADAAAALEVRRAKERRFAEIFYASVCRTSPSTKDKDRRASEDKQKALLRLFLKRSRDEP